VNALEKGTSRNKPLFSILLSMPEDRLEELISALEKELEKYLENALPPKTDYSVVISVAKKEDRVDVALDVVIRGGAAHQGDFDKVASEAIGYAKRRLVKLLEESEAEAIKGD